MTCSLLSAERQGFFLRCATKALRDNEPFQGSHRVLYARKPLKFSCFLSGKAGIRTLGTRKGTTVFETAPIDHSGTFPIGLIYMQKSPSGCLRVQS